MCIVGGNVYSYNHYGNQCGGFLKKFKKELPYDLPIPLLDIYTKELKAGFQRGIWTPMFTAALVTKAKGGSTPQMNG